MIFRGTASAAAIALALLLGACVGPPAPIKVRDPEALPASGYYTIQAGETLYSIAWRHGLDYRTVARWNRIDSPYRIYPGQRLRLTGPAPAVAVARVEPPKPVARPPARPPVAENRPSQPSRPAPAPKPAPKPAPNPQPAAESRPQPAPKPAASGELAWRWPVEGTLLRRFSANGQGKQGVEIGGRLGQSITASAAGTVVYSGSGLRGYGNLIILKHNSRYLTAYGYNQDLLVKEGERVSAGQPIATMGVSSSRQPALHFELRRDGKPVDPLSYLPEK